MVIYCDSHDTGPPKNEWTSTIGMPFCHFGIYNTVCTHRFDILWPSYFRPADFGKVNFSVLGRSRCSFAQVCFGAGLQMLSTLVRDQMPKQIFAGRLSHWKHRIAVTRLSRSATSLDFKSPNISWELRFAICQLRCSSEDIACRRRTAMEEYAKTFKFQRQSGTFARESEIPCSSLCIRCPGRGLEARGDETTWKTHGGRHFGGFCGWDGWDGQGNFCFTPMAMSLETRPQVGSVSTPTTCLEEPPINVQTFDRSWLNEWVCYSIWSQYSNWRVSKKSSLIWYDYFSIPQIDGDSWTSSDFKKPIEEALNSIAAYIARSTFFFVLCPVVENPDCTELFGPSTWASRGWCRLEKTVRELLPEGNSFVVIHDANHMEAILTPANSLVLAGPSGEGSFGIGEDRERLGRVLLILLKKLVLHHLSSENFLAYRTYLNLQSYYLRGFALETAELFHPIPDVDLFGSISDVFLAQNGFRNIREVDQNGWSPLCCAVLRGDPHIVRSLVAHAADPNTTTKKNHPIVGLAAGLSVSAIGAFFRAQGLFASIAGISCRCDSRFKSSNVWRCPW